MSNKSRRPEFDYEAEQDQELHEPPRYQVLLFNDDYTSMDFVVDILKQVFNKTEDEAVAIMYAVHTSGMGQCGVYTAELAETKVETVHRLARAKGFPLRSGLEEV